MEAATRIHLQIQSLFIDWRDRLIAALTTKTARDAQLVLFSQLLSGVVGFTANLVLIRCLSVRDFGLFSLFNSMFMLLGGLLHLGWADTYVRFGAIHRQEPFFPSLQRRALAGTILGSSLISAALFVFAPHVVERLYHRPEALTIFRASVIVAALNTWILFFLSDFRVQSKYRALAGMNVGPQVLRLIALAMLFLGGALTLQSTISVYAFVSLVFCAICAAIFLKSKPVFGAAQLVPTALRKDIRNYNGWLLFNLVSFTLIGNIDAQILAYYKANQTIAEFSVAGRLTLPFYMVVMAINTAVLPRISASHTERDLRAVLSKLSLVLVPLSAALAAVTLFGVPLILKIAGPQYAGITTLMRLQLLCTLLVILWYPLSTILLGMGRAKSIAILSFTQLLIDIALDLAWIPSAGAEGAVRSSVVIHLLGLIWTLTDICWQIRLKKREEARL
jgi:O-antigen/teichoic acid export membrane protein